MFKPFNLLLMLSIIAMVGFTACDNDDDETPTPEPQSIVEIATGDAQFSTLVEALTRVNLVSTLEGDGPFTVFAPTNAAFTALGVDLSTISDADLTEILLYHVLGAEVKAGDIQEGQTYASTAAATGPGNTQLSVLIEKTGSSVSLNGKINVTTADVDATNGVIHIVDAVILPMDVVDHAVANSNFTELVTALGAAEGDLVGTLSDDATTFTVFAPLNSAFTEIADVTATLTEAQLAAVLTYHVVGGANVLSTDLTDAQVVGTVNGDEFTVNIGDGVTITDTQGNKANVVLTDVQATNGVIHVLDKVILPNL